MVRWQPWHCWLDSLASWVQGYMVIIARASTISELHLPEKGRLKLSYKVTHYNRICFTCMHLFTWLWFTGGFQCHMVLQPSTIWLACILTEKSSITRLLGKDSPILRPNGLGMRLGEGWSGDKTIYIDWYIPRTLSARNPAVSAHSW